MSHIESLFNHTFAISRTTRASDGQGGWAEVVDSSWEVLGRMRPASSAERQVAAQEQRHLSHVLYLLAGTDVARGDLVSGGGVTVLVRGVREPSQAGHHLEVDCQEVQTEPGEVVGS